MGIPVSVVLPAHNEAAAIVHTVRELDRELARRFDSAELIVVDDGSSDATADKLHRLRLWCEITYVRHERRLGKGRAIRTGMSAARGEVVAYTDADLPISATSVADAVQRVLSGQCDLCVGNRFHKFSRRFGQGHPTRRVLGSAYRAYAKVMDAGAGVIDPACCLKVFTATLARHIAASSTVDGFLFDSEALAIAQRSGAIIEEIAVEWTDKRAYRSMLRLALEAGPAISEMYQIWKLAGRSVVSAIDKNGD